MSRTLIAAAVLLAPQVVWAHAGHDHPEGEDHPHDPPAAPPASPASDDGDPELGDVAGLAVEEDEAEAAQAEQEAAPARDEEEAPTPEPGTSELERSETIPDTTWRRRARRDDSADGDLIEPTHFLAEVRFGPYLPQVDDEEGLAGSPYADFFGNEPLFYFGLEVDWLPLYLPYVASVGPAFGWGFTSASAKARLAEDPSQQVESETELTIFPMHASAAIRFDGLLREMGFPVVPYGKIGFGWGIWSVSGGADAVDGVSAEGTSYGIHAAAGGSIALNAFDRSAAMTMREDTGIRYAHLWGEWMGDFLGDIGPDGQMRVGTSTVVVGLGIEF